MEKESIFCLFQFLFLNFQTLVDAMVIQGVDLIILEGMGRAIHTNLYSKFNCESLKVAVLKNRWLAQRLGGEMFAVVFKYENGCIIANKTGK